MRLRHSPAGVPARVVNERLVHATVAFTLQTYTHLIPGMDQQAADSVAALILGEPDTDSQAHAHPKRSPAARIAPHKRTDLGESPGQRQ